LVKGDANVLAQLLELSGNQNKWRIQKEIKKEFHPKPLEKHQKTLKNTSKIGVEMTLAPPVLKVMQTNRK